MAIQEPRSLLWLNGRADMREWPTMGLGREKEVIVQLTFTKN